jgi:hypothetical protein
MTMLASGTFDVKLHPLDLHDAAIDATLGRRGIEKQFHGHLEAESHGEMLSAGTATEGSAAYVAIERVAGTLHGMAGSFVLQHTGIMNRGASQLTVAVVPDSGTGELVGLSGEMTINIVGGKHYYEFEYVLAKRD